MTIDELHAMVADQGVATRDGCPIIGSFLRAWNDSLGSDDERTSLLMPLIPQLVATRSTAEVELTRVMLIVDWMCREFLPCWLDLTPALRGHADALRSAKPIQSWSDLDAISSLIFAAKNASAGAWAGAWDGAWAAAWDAARDAGEDGAWAAAWDAAWAAAWDGAEAAAGDAVWAAAGDAARAARAGAGYAVWDAAGYAVWDAARDAARAAAWAAASAAAGDAAGDAARAALQPAKKILQSSAVGLVERMIRA